MNSTHLSQCYRSITDTTSIKEIDIINNYLVNCSVKLVLDFHNLSNSKDALEKISNISNLCYLSLSAAIPKDWFNSIETVTKLVSIPNQTICFFGLDLKQEQWMIFCKALSLLNRKIYVQFMFPHITTNNMVIIMRQLWASRYPIYKLSASLFRQDECLVKIFKQGYKIEKKLEQVVALCSARCIPRVSGRSVMWKIPSDLLRALVDLLL